MAPFTFFVKVGTTNFSPEHRFDAFPNREWIISPSALLLTSRFHFR
jgi:hypothetical protein